MILTCPHCATQYRVDAAKFPASGRDVRCKKCSTVWHQDAPAPEPQVLAAPEPVFAVPEPQVAPEPDVETRPAAYVPPERVIARVANPPVETAPREPSRLAARLGLGLGWLALVGVVLAIGFAAFVWRQQVALAWPRTASLYAVLGLTVNPTGLGFRDVSDRQETEDGQAVLAIAGKLVNLSAHKIAVPPIEVTLTDSRRHEVLRKSFASGVAQLEPGQIATFLARLSSPPSAARHLELRFAAR